MAECHWPIVKLRVEFDLPELKRVVAVTTVVPNLILELLYKFSNLHKVCRIVAYCLRFRKRQTKTLRRPGILLLHEEITDALNILCRAVQEEVFSREFKLLRDGKVLNCSSSVISLSPFVDDCGLMRVGGRLRNSQLSYNARHQILLPKSHRLTELIIQSEHIRNLHTGLQGTIAAKRQNF